MTTLRAIDGGADPAGFAAERKKCTVCQRPIRKTTKGDTCTGCRKATRAQKRALARQEAAADRKARQAARDAARRLCAGEACEAILGKKNRSGMCKHCRAEARGKATRLRRIFRRVGKAFAWMAAAIRDTRYALAVMERDRIMKRDGRYWTTKDGTKTFRRGAVMFWADWKAAERLGRPAVLLVRRDQTCHMMEDEL